MSPVQSGICYDIHTYSILSFTCLGTLINLFNAAICIFNFGYCLRQMQRNHFRALAGYTKNTVI